MRPANRTRCPPGRGNGKSEAPRRQLDERTGRCENVQCPGRGLGLPRKPGIEDGGIPCPIRNPGLSLTLQGVIMSALSVASSNCSAIPNSVRQWLAARYLSDPTPDQLVTNDVHNGKKVTFERLDTFTEYLLGLGQDVLLTLEACRQAGLIHDGYVNLQPKGVIPPEAKRTSLRPALRLDLPIGVQTRVIMIDPSVLSPNPTALPSTKSITEIETTTPHEKLLSAERIAAILGQPVKQVRVLLCRFAKSHPDCLEPVPKSRRSEAKKLYRVDDVLPHLKMRFSIGS
jgi:hypothetical protein